MKVEISFPDLIGADIKFSFSDFDDFDKLNEISDEFEKILKKHKVEITYK